MNFENRLHVIRERVQEAARVSGRTEKDIKIIAVSKGQSAEAVLNAVACGQHVFGENRVQEARSKMETVAAQSERGFPKTEWHLIGRLQTNKVRYLHQREVLHFEVIHSLDRMDLADALSQRFAAYEIRQAVLVQINVSGETSKAGIAPSEAEGFLRMAGRLPGISVKGLMTMAPETGDPEETRPVFREMSRLAARLRALYLPGCELEHLSMGMTNDFDVAVEEGATMIRVGRALFRGNAD